MEPQSGHGVRESEISRADEGHGAVDERRDHGTRRDDEDDRERLRERGEDRQYQHRTEDCVHHDETPGVGVEVAQRKPHRVPRPHPLIPAAVTPETKKRWKTRKMTRIGAIAMMLPAIICGHSDW